MKNLIVAAIALTFASCASNSPEIQSGEVKGWNPSEEITYPVRIQYIQRSGMKYMIASAQFGESGVHIQNLTLDSLQVEFYKRELKLNSQ